MKPTSSSSDHNHVLAKGLENRLSLIWSFVSPLKEMKCTNDTRKLIHAFKVAIALVVISLLYLLDPLFNQVGENAMWAIMTVVVMFEFYAGATLCKGINRGIGTLVGGGLGCLAAVLADEIGGDGNPIIVACSVFVFGGAATYCRMVPRIKKSYDYGFMISILTFNLVAVSGVRADKVVEMAGQRLANIGMGFAVSIFVNLLVSPMWSSDELHYSTASKFGKLASSIEGCLDEYFKVTSEKEDQAEAGGEAYDQACKSILTSKSSEQSLGNFAKWEPWHGKFGYNYPWENYLQLGEHLREVAAMILSIQECLRSPKQPQAIKRQAMKEPCEVFMMSILWILKELGNSIENMEQCQVNVLLSQNLQSMRLQLAPLSSALKSESLEAEENLAVTSFNFLMMELVEKIETLTKKVEQLGEVANFRARKVDV